MSLQWGQCLAFTVNSMENNFKDSNLFFLTCCTTVLACSSWNFAFGYINSSIEYCFSGRNFLVYTQEKMALARV